jgi:hypothetical protein
MALTVVGCGKFQIPGGEVSPESPEESREEAVEPSQPNFRPLASLIDSDDQESGLVIGMSNGYTAVYLSEDDIYVSIVLLTGEYRQYPARSGNTIYFSGTSCTGTGIMLGDDWAGELGKTVIKGSNGTFYSIDSLGGYTDASPFSYQSRLTQTGCVSESSNISTGTVPVVTVATSLGNLTSGAPYTLRYEE